MRDRPAVGAASVGLVVSLLLGIAGWAGHLPTAAAPERAAAGLEASHVAPTRSADAAAAAVAPTLASTVAPPAPDAGDVIAPPPPVFDGEPSAPSTAPVPVPAGVGQPGVYGVFIGVDDYPGSSGDLNFAVADADTADAAVGSLGAPADRRLVLRDGEATIDGIRSAVAWLVERAGPGSVAVFMFAGHVRDLGGGTEAIVGADGELLTDAELAALLAPSRADHIWVVLASCYAGGFTEVLAPGRILTAAAPAGQLAYESSAMGGSYLVGYLFREGWLERQAGGTVQEAFAYTYQQIASSKPDRVPVQFDHAGVPVRIDVVPTHVEPPPVEAPPAPPPPPPSTTTTTTAPPIGQPAEQPCLLGLCRRS